MSTECSQPCRGDGLSAALRVRQLSSTLSFCSCPGSSTNGQSSLSLKAGAFFSAGDLSSGYMDDIKQETDKGPAYPVPPSRPINSVTAACDRLSASTSGSRPGCPPSPPRVLKLNNLDNQDSRGQNQNSHNGALAAGHPVRNLYPENFVPSFPRGSSGRYGAR